MDQRSAQLAAIVAASSDAIISIGTDLAVQTWNAGAHRLFGYSEAEAIGRSIVELTIPDGYEVERSATFAATISSRTAVLRETMRRRKDGRLFPVETNVSPIVDGAGNVTGLSIIVRDVTERRRAQEELRRHVERQALLLEITSDLIRAAEPSQLSRLTFQHIRPAFAADICLNFRLDLAGQHLRLEFESGIPPELSAAIKSLELGQAYCGVAAASRQPVVADKERIACDPNGAWVHALGATAFVCHPLLASEGRLLGTFAVTSRTRESFTDDEVAWLGTVSTPSPRPGSGWRRNRAYVRAKSAYASRSKPRNSDGGSTIPRAALSLVTRVAKKFLMLALVPSLARNSSQNGWIRMMRKWFGRPWRRQSILSNRNRMRPSTGFANRVAESAGWKLMDLPILRVRGVSNGPSVSLVRFRTLQNVRSASKRSTSSCAKSTIAPKTC